MKARQAGRATSDLPPMLKAMDEHASKQVADVGRLKCLSLIHILEVRQQAIGSLLGERS